MKASGYTRRASPPRKQPSVPVGVIPADRYAQRARQDKIVPDTTMYSTESHRKGRVCVTMVERIRDGKGISEFVAILRQAPLQRAPYRICLPVPLLQYAPLKAASPSKARSSSNKTVKKNARHCTRASFVSHTTTSFLFFFLPESDKGSAEA